MRAIVTRKKEWIRAMSLDEDTGLDLPGVKVRSAQGLDARRSRSCRLPSSDAASGTGRQLLCHGILDLEQVRKVAYQISRLDSPRAESSRVCTPMHASIADFRRPARSRRAELRS
jgi:hypothetical protein